MIRSSNGIPLIRVERGELVLNTGVMDIHVVGQSLEILQNQDLPTIRLTKHDTGVDIHEGIFFGRVAAVQVFRNKVVVHPMGMTMMGCGIADCRVGLQV